MTLIKNLIGGLAGAVALNVLHQAAAALDPEAPRIDLIGEEAFSKTVEAMGKTPPTGRKLYDETLTADLATNAVYYSLIGTAKDKDLLMRGAAFGLLAGVGALTLTKKFGLNDEPVNKSRKAQWLTVCWYVTGGVVSALAIKILRYT